METRKNTRKIGLLTTVAILGLATAVAPMLNADTATFTVSASLYSSVSLQNVAPMTFPSHEVVASDTDVILAPTDAGAAKFDATGDVSRTAIGSVTTQTVTLTCTTGICSGDTMEVKSFTYGGAMDSSGNATFDAQGKLTGLAIGSTMTVTSTAKPGSYSGTATFSLAYT